MSIDTKQGTRAHCRLRVRLAARLRRILVVVDPYEPRSHVVRSWHYANIPTSGSISPTSGPIGSVTISEGSP